jgi:HAD superfamily hydrolase (TIGR01549 family)
VTAPFAVGFDFDHTLGLDNGLETTAYYRLAADLGHALSERDRLWAVVIGDLLGRFRGGTITLDRGVEEFVEHLGFRYLPEHALAYRNDCFRLIDELVMPIEGACDVLAALAERAVPTAILTNGWSPLQQRKIGRALGYTGPVLVSDELGVLKPEPAAFSRLVDVLGVARERVWFVGDNPATDIAGSQSAGLHGVWFDWEHMTYPADAPSPESRIKHLIELLEVLPGPDVSAENVRH